MPESESVHFGKLSRRQVSVFIVESALARTGGCSAALARLINHSPTAIARYREGKVVPKRDFFLDLFDKVPDFGISFRQVAAPLGYGWMGSRDLRRFRRFSDFFSAVRIQNRESRDLFAAKLAVAAADVRDIEHGIIPDRRVIDRFVKLYLAPDLDAAALKGAFSVLDPSSVELGLRDKMIQLQGMKDDHPNIVGLKNEVACELLCIARVMAQKVGRMVGRPRDADEVCGEAVHHVMRKFNGQKGLILPYLKKVVGALVRELNRADMQSGTVAALREFGPLYKEAWSELSQQLQRDPNEREIAEYSGMSETAVLEVARALHAGYAASIDAMDQHFQPATTFVLHYYDEPDSWRDDESIARVRRLPSVQQELLLMHFIDELPSAQIAGRIGRPEDEVDLKLRWAVTQLGG